MKLIYEKSQAGPDARTRSRSYDLPAARGARRAPPRASRRACRRLAEPELVRHFTELSTRNFGVDTGFYPLGSCTMKHNPRVNERVVALPGLRRPPPAAGGGGRAGRARAHVAAAGDPRRGLRPRRGVAPAGRGLPGRADRPHAHARVLRRPRRDDSGGRIVVPDTAHGTNPASVTMAGYELVGVATDARGNVDLEDLRAKVDETTAGLMLTNPSTLGLFDEGIEEVAADLPRRRRAHATTTARTSTPSAASSRPGDMGFDIVHINLHKTFSQPHGGGGPGGGPIAVRDMLEPYLPVPVVVRDVEGAGFRSTRPAEVDRQGPRLRRPVRRLRPLVRVSSARTARSSARCPRRPC